MVSTAQLSADVVGGVLAEFSEDDEPRVRERVAAVRLTEAEWLQWRVAAMRAGRQQLGRWVRETVNDLLSDAPKKLASRGDETARFERVLRELSRVGNNLNQLTHAANSGADVSREAGEVFAEVRAVVRDISAELNR